MCQNQCFYRNYRYFLSLDTPLGGWERAFLLFWLNPGFIKNQKNSEFRCFISLRIKPKIRSAVNFSVFSVFSKTVISPRVYRSGFTEMSLRDTVYDTTWGNTFWRLELDKTPFRSPLAALLSKWHVLLHSFPFRAVARRGFAVLKVRVRSMT